MGNEKNMADSINFNRISVLSLFVTTFITGCATNPIGVIDKQFPVPSPAESVVVQGVKPGSYEVVFAKGRIDSGKFEQTKHVGVLVGAPNDGYLVGKLQAGDVVALTLFLRPKGESNRRRNFDFCGKDVLVFTIPEGKVAYLGDISIEETGERSFNVTYSADAKAAREYIDTQFPKLSGRLEQIIAQVMPYKCPQSYQWYMIYKGR